MISFRKIKLFNLNSKKFYSVHNHHEKFKYTFKDGISDLNLKWTIPTSLIISLSLWFYIKNQLPNQPDQIKIQELLPPIISLKKPEKLKIIDHDTGYEFPTEIQSNHIQVQESLRLIGLGVRTVSFLSIKVYVAALYVDPRALRSLRVIPGWNDDVNKDKFLSQPNQQSNQIQGENLMANLLNAPVHFAIQIAPVRNTDFTHLRDGFCRSLTSRIQLASKAGKISEMELQKASLSINTFRSFFPTGVSVPKGKTLTIIRTSNQNLIVEYDGKKLGELDDSIIANQLILAYFADKDPISPKLKESVAEGFSSLYTTTLNEQASK